MSHRTFRDYTIPHVSITIWTSQRYYPVKASIPTTRSPQNPLTSHLAEAPTKFFPCVPVFILAKEPVTDRKAWNSSDFSKYLLSRIIEQWGTHTKSSSENLKPSKKVKYVDACRRTLPESLSVTRNSTYAYNANSYERHRRVQYLWESCRKVISHR